MAASNATPPPKRSQSPIYQNVAYEFASADEGAALFNLEQPGFRYSRIANPTVDILERRVAALEGGASALCVASGQAALAYTFLTLADRGGSIVAPPQLYGTSHTLLAHTLKHNGVQGALRRERPRRRHRSRRSMRRRAPSFARASATPPATSSTSRLTPK